MNQMMHRFTDASSLQAAISKYRDLIVGKTYTGFYEGGCCFYTYGSAESMCFIVIDDLCIGLLSFEDSTLEVIVSSIEDFEVGAEPFNDDGDIDVVFHSKLLGVSDQRLTWRPYIPATGQKIVDVGIDLFSGPIYDSYTDEIVRPEGGDYFHKVWVLLEDGTRLAVSAEAYDWTRFSYENLNSFDFLKKMLSPEYDDYRLEHHVWDILEVSNLTTDQMGELLAEFLRWHTTHNKMYATDHILHIFSSFGLTPDYTDCYGNSISYYIEEMARHNHELYEKQFELPRKRAHAYRFVAACRKANVPEEEIKQIVHSIKGKSLEEKEAISQQIIQDLTDRGLI